MNIFSNIFTEIETLKLLINRQARTGNGTSKFFYKNVADGTNGEGEEILRNRFDFTGTTISLVAIL